ncbi:MAG TPA: PilZ domain-containing protein [Pyrinomonadaceae bacterium]|nr:PilZ domain-containing protein [Pyrinomonadaceae bacterium]
MERRRHTRHRARLDASLQFSTLVIESKPTAEGMRRMLAAAGTTCDLSESGLALSVPQEQVDEHYLALENCTLQIMLELPDGAVEIEAKPIRYEKVGSDYLIGAEIIKMADDDREAFQSYLRKLQDE